MTTKTTTIAPSSKIILSGIDLMKDAEVLAHVVWTIGNRLTEFEKKKYQIIEACENALQSAYVKGFDDARRI